MMIRSQMENKRILSLIILVLSDTFYLAHVDAFELFIKVLLDVKYPCNHQRTFKRKGSLNRM